MVTMGYGIRQGFEHDQSNAVAATVAIGRLIEWLALTSAAKETRLSKIEEIVNSANDIDAACECHRAFPGLDGAACSMDCYHRRRASRVYDFRWTTPPEEVTDSAALEGTDCLQ
jgi:hypothetical protein